MMTVDGLSVRVMGPANRCQGHSHLSCLIGYSREDDLSKTCTEGGIKRWNGGNNERCNTGMKGPCFGQTNAGHTYTHHGLSSNALHKHGRRRHTTDLHGLPPVVGISDAGDGRCC